MLQTLGNRIDENGQAVPISLDNDVQLFVSMKQGEEVDKDCPCNSAFMEKVMPKVAHEMHRAYHWTPETDKLYLVMDNAGGHGTDDSKSRYTEVMRNRNIEIIWQVLEYDLKHDLKDVSEINQICTVVKIEKSK